MSEVDDLRSSILSNGWRQGSVIDYHTLKESAEKFGSNIDSSILDVEEKGSITLLL